MAHSKLYTFYITLLLITTSGTSLIGQIYYQEGIYLLLLSSLFFFNKTIDKKKMILLLFLLTIILSNYLLSDTLQVSYYIGLAIRLVSVFIIFNSVNTALVARYYLYIIAVIGVLSIIFYFIGLFVPEFIREYVPAVEVWGGYSRVTPFYTYSFYTFDRNNGIWWEPGAYQCFLNLAIFLLTRIQFHKKSISIWLFLIFFVCLITTFSTNGYFIFLLVLISQSKKLISPKYIRLVVPAIILLLVLFLVEETTIGTINNKFNPASDSYESYTRRMYDLNMGIELISQKPIFGWGFKNNNMYDGFLFESSSNGLVMVTAQLGFLAMAVYLLINFIKFKNLSENFIEFIVYIITYCLLISSENLIFQPLFLTVLFLSGKRSDHYIVFKNKEYIPINNG